MKKARSKEKNAERSGGGGSGVLDCVKFHSNRSRRISGCTHAQSEQLQSGDARHQRARGRMQFRHGDHKNSAHFTFTPPLIPVVPVSRVRALSFIILYFFSPVDSTRRLTRSPTRDSRACIDDDECIAHCVLCVHIRDAGLAVFG